MTSPFPPNIAFIFFNEISMIDLLCTSLVGKLLPDGIHPSHFALVHYMVRLGDGKTPLSLAGALQVTKATMSHSLKVLEKHGFIETIPCEDDARSKQVFLTQAGRRFHVNAVEALSPTFKNFLRDEHRQIMANAMPGLAAIRNLLDENREPYSGE